MLTLFDLTDLEVPAPVDGNPAADRAAPGSSFRGYSPLDDDAEIRAQFTARYGAPPAEIRRSAGAALAGPIPAAAPPQTCDVTPRTPPRGHATPRSRLP